MAMAEDYRDYTAKPTEHAGFRSNADKSATRTGACALGTYIVPDIESGN
jgi:hypothetical protein